jgi:mycofactocin system creatininase family protein
MVGERRDDGENGGVLQERKPPVPEVVQQCAERLGAHRDPVIEPPPAIYPDLVRLTEMTWPDADAAQRRVLVVPVGSLEQHGPHLPLDTDTRIAVAVAERAVARAGLPGVALAPPVTIGASGEHAAFPGTLSIGTEALTAVLTELGRHASLHWPVMLLVNGHGGNAMAIEAALGRLRYEGRDAHAWHAHVPGGDPHAGRTETSLLLAIAPEVVQLDQAAAGDTRPARELMPLLREHGVRAISPNGVLGDPEGASPAEGEQLLDDLTRRLAAELASKRP